MFSDIEEGKIMADEVEEVYSMEGGLGTAQGTSMANPHTGAKQWKYAGKTYEQEITPEKLRGLRNQRLIDNMIKWGDTEGAMKMQGLQADIESKTASTENLQQKTNLLIAQFPDLAKKIGYENLAIQSGTALNLAQKEKILRMLPHDERYAAAQLVGLNWDNKYLKKSFDDRVNIKKQESLQADIKTEEDEVARDISVALKPSDINAGIAQNEATVSDSSVTIKENEIKLSEADEKIAVNDMMATFRNRAGKAPHLGGFESNEQAKEWMVNEMYKINPMLADDMKSSYGANELANITQESTLFTEKAMSAWKTGGIVGLAKTVDDLNGVNKTEIEYNDKNKNIATLYEVDEKGTRLRPIATGNLKDGSFLMNLQQELDPARSMAISKEYYDNLKIQADIAYTEAMAEKAEADKDKSLKETEILSSSKPLGKDEYFVQRLITDPNDTVALHGLLGLDLTREEIDDMVLNETLRQNENKTSNASGEANYNRDGLTTTKNNENKETKTKDNAVPGSLQDQIATLNSRISAFAAGSDDSKAAQAELAKLTTVEGLTESIAALQKEIDALPRKANGDFELGKLGVGGAGAKKKAIDDKVKLLADMKASLESMSKGLGG